MELGKFAKTFVDGFETHIEEIASGNGSKLMKLRDEYEQKAVSYYDEIVDAGATVTIDGVEECIEIEKEKRNISI